GGPKSGGIHDGAPHVGAHPAPGLHDTREKEYGGEEGRIGQRGEREQHPQQRGGGGAAGAGLGFLAGLGSDLARRRPEVPQPTPHQHDDTAALHGEQPPSMVPYGALKGHDEGGRRPARDARRDAIHRGGPEGHGAPRPPLARQRLPENRDGNRPRRYCQDQPKPQTDEPSGHHGASPLTPCIPDFPGRSYWLPGSEAPTVSEKRDAFVRLST